MFEAQQGALRDTHPVDASTLSALSQVREGLARGASVSEVITAISQDSDDDKNDRKNRKGFLNEEMVEKMNFGGGDENPSD